jgi:EmrB/QacA subfamily drug resistance transporter
MAITEKNRKWWILAAMTTTISMIFVDVTVLPVVLPTLQRELLISDLGLQWIVNAYTFILAVFVLAGGKLGDMWGLKKAFCLGITIFAFASAVCGLCNTELELILSRGLQGIGGAFLLPATQGIIISHFPPHERGKALGLFVSTGSIFLAIGPLVGGALTSYFSWHYVFWINIPIAIIGLTMAFFCVPPMRGRKTSFDLRGFFILAIGIASMIFSLMHVRDWGWISYRFLLLLSIGIFSLIFLFKRKHKPDASILDFELMGTKTFIASSSSIFCNQFIAMVTVFWAIYFQNILGFSPSKAGVYSFLANIPILFAAPLGGFLVDRFGPRFPAMTGFGLIFLALNWLTLFFRHENIWLLFPTLLLFGFGASMIYTPCFVAMMNEVPEEKRGGFTGINTTLRQFSSTLGLALFGTLYSTTYFTKLEQSLQANEITRSFSSKEFEGLLSKSPVAMHNLSHLPASDAPYVFQSAKNAFLDAFSRINITAALFAFAGIIIAWSLLKNQPIHRNSKG